MPVNVFPAQPSNIGDLVRLNGLVQDLHAQLHPEIFRRDWDTVHLQQDWLLRLKETNNTILLAEFGGRTVGYIWFELQNRPEDALRHGTKCIYVHHIAVDHEARAKKVGSMLLNSAETAARRLNISTVLLDAWTSNSVAQSFFTLKGFRPINAVLAKQLATQQNEIG